MSVRRRAKIVATVGPATDTEESLEALLAAGVDVVRLNFSHGTHDEHARRIGMVRAIAERLKRPIAVMLDLQGPKIRTGTLVGGKPVELKRGQTFKITTHDDRGHRRARLDHLPRPACGLPRRRHRAGGRRKIKLSVDHDHRREVDVSGAWTAASLKEHKGINLPGVAVSAPALTEKDAGDLAFGLEHGRGPRGAQLRARAARPAPARAFISAARQGGAR